MLTRYQNEIVKSGIVTMSQQLAFTGPPLLEQVECVPDNVGAATQFVSNLSGIRMPVINADTSAIQNPFMLIVEDIKSQGEAITADNNAVIAEALQCLRKELSKRQDSLDLKKITAKRLVTAVIRAISTTDIFGDALHCIGYAYKKVLGEVREAIHNE